MLFAFVGIFGVFAFTMGHLHGYNKGTDDTTEFWKELEKHGI